MFLGTILRKRIKQFLPTLTVLALILAVVTSCDWEKLDRSPEPDHPLYVTYTITASSLNFTGPEELLNNIQDWVKTNQIAYDKKVNYKNGEASEFTKTDEEAVKKYDEFVPKFKTYLEKDVKESLKKGTYGDPTDKVTAIFAVYAARTQGESGNLKYEQISFTYP